MTFVTQAHYDRSLELRSARSALRRELGAMRWPAARHRVAELLRDPPDYVAAGRLRVVLTMVPGITIRSLPRLLGRAQISPYCAERRVGPWSRENKPGDRALTADQRERLAKALDR